MAFQLREYQQEAVDATLKHFRKTDDSAVIVLPTGAGKSLVIAELARLARQKILVLAHVKELVEQNHQKYQAYGLEAGIYSAGLGQKVTEHQVTFASIQSVARNLDAFSEHYSLVIIDECHRVADSVDDPEDDNGVSTTKTSSTSQYQQLIQRLRQHNKGLKVLGLTATPYRMGLGWIYQKHYHGFFRSNEQEGAQANPPPFTCCIYELPLIFMINRNYLTPPKMVDAAVEQYDFSALMPNASGELNGREVNELLASYPRVTQGISEQVVSLAESQNRRGVMIFAATVEHAKEILGYLPEGQARLVIGDTVASERANLIADFKAQYFRYLVNVSVLTTGFDAPHVDFIAILRPTQSVSLYQQIVGRGLRLFENKEDCLVVDYAGNHFNLFYPEIGRPKPESDSKPVMVNCPDCGFANTFWGKVDDQGLMIEHYGRRCAGMIGEADEVQVQCDYRFVFKECNHCGAENDIAARRCQHCHEAIVDPDDQLKNALKLKDAKVIRCAGLSFDVQRPKLKVIYHDEQGVELSESFDFSKAGQVKRFNQLFAKRVSIPQSIASELGHSTNHRPVFQTIDDVIPLEPYFKPPDFVIARKQGKFWRIQERMFDYQGKYRKANSL